MRFCVGYIAWSDLLSRECLAVNILLWSVDRY